MEAGTANEFTVCTQSLFRRLKEWDKGTPGRRMALIAEFLEECKSLEGNIDLLLAEGGSLLAARVLVWLQMTYMRHKMIGDVLKVLEIFLTSIDGTRYATEFIEAGLLITLLDILMKRRFDEPEKLLVIDILQIIATKGRRFKEAICESHGIKVISAFIYSEGTCTPAILYGPPVGTEEKALPAPAPQQVFMATTEEAPQVEGERPKDAEPAVEPAEPTESADMTTPEPHSAKLTRSRPDSAKSERRISMGSPEPESKAAESSKSQPRLSIQSPEYDRRMSSELPSSERRLSGEPTPKSKTLKDSGKLRTKMSSVSSKGMESKKPNPSVSADSRKSEHGVLTDPSKPKEKTSSGSSTKSESRATDSKSSKEGLSTKLASEPRTSTDSGKPSRGGEKKLLADSEVLEPRRRPTGRSSIPETSCESNGESEVRARVRVQETSEEDSSQSSELSCVVETRSGTEEDSDHHTLSTLSESELGEEEGIPAEAQATGRGRSFLLRALRRFEHDRASQKEVSQALAAAYDDLTKPVRQRLLEDVRATDEDLSSESTSEEIETMALALREAALDDMLVPELLLRAKRLLGELSRANPLYETDLNRALVRLIAADNPKAAVIACQVLRSTLPVSMDFCDEVLEPALEVLGSGCMYLTFEAVFRVPCSKSLNPHFYETPIVCAALKLLEIIVMSPWKTDLLNRLVELADISLEGFGMPDLDHSGSSIALCEDFAKIRSLLEIQSDAILAIGHLMTSWTVEELIAIEAEVVLVMTISNKFSPDNQHRACRALRKLVHLAPSLGDKLAEQFPPGLLRHIMLDPVEAVNKLRPLEVNCLRDWVKRKTERRLSQLKRDLSSIEGTSVVQLSN